MLLIAGVQTLTVVGNRFNTTAPPAKVTINANQKLNVSLNIL